MSKSEKPKSDPLTLEDFEKVRLNLEELRIRVNSIHYNWHKGFFLTEDNKLVLGVFKVIHIAPELISRIAVHSQKEIETAKED